MRIPGFNLRTKNKFIGEKLRPCEQLVRSENQPDSRVNYVAVILLLGAFTHYPEIDLDGEIALCIAYFRSNEVKETDGKIV